MNISPAKENILKKIRKALTESTPLPFSQSEGNSSVYQPAFDELELIFAQEFTKLLGKFAYCENLDHLKAQLTALGAEKKWEQVYFNGEDQTLVPLIQNSWIQPHYTSDLATCDAAVTQCELLVARTGSIVLSSTQTGRSSSVYAPVHICIAFTDQLVYDIKDAMEKLKEKYQGALPSFITFATGPSRTADIEKTLVVGVHGPKEVYLFLVEKE